MNDENEIRPGEVVIPWRASEDASIAFIGRIQTPWKTRAECPRQGQMDGPLCQISLDEIWREALTGISRCPRLEVIYWLHLSRRDLVLQCARQDKVPRGAFSLRSPLRPNPIGTSLVKLEAVHDCTLMVRGLDCIDGTPLLDIKPDRKALPSSAETSDEGFLR
jgi:tRNA-Thr(GGU) m(6)t(6)A37 methyltransferase TsaA